MSNFQLTYRSINGTIISQIVQANTLTQAAAIGDARLQNDRTLSGFALIKVAITTAS